MERAIRTGLPYVTPCHRLPQGLQSAVRTGLPYGPPNGPGFLGRRRSRLPQDPVTAVPQATAGPGYRTSPPVPPSRTPYGPGPLGVRRTDRAPSTYAGPQATAVQGNRPLPSGIHACRRLPQILVTAHPQATAVPENCTSPPGLPCRPWWQATAVPKKPKSSEKTLKIANFAPHFGCYAESNLKKPKKIPPACSLRSRRPTGFFSAFLGWIR